jgi:hypothetical protein
MQIHNAQMRHSITVVYPEAGPQLVQTQTVCFLIIAARISLSPCAGNGNIVPLAGIMPLTHLPLGFSVMGRSNVSLICIYISLEVFYFHRLLFLRTDPSIEFGRCPHNADFPL